ncbi:hypothetical protein [Pelomonas sp. Root1237]|uniref:hypothetical protein n=1 Tax=Pelomonas sp. Root1237 TaxID=1736434 RepID=UPI0006F42C4B|nr:hypothetical protein [Pelomonas sp. Root1237]KQV95667.1 hypothetical protein ASC91_25550 [Pelomonas sp. Root1237]
MRMILVTLLSLLSLSQDAAACSVLPSWRPPTVETALSQAAVVLQAKVIAVQREAGVSLATVSVEHVLKGKYSGHIVETGGGSLCGIGTFNVGQTYVLFFEQRGEWWVNALVQPHATAVLGSRRLDASEVIPAVAAISKQIGEVPGVWVPETQWDLPAYKTTLSHLKLLAKREQEYQLQLRHRTWLVWAGLALALMAGFAGAVGLRSRRLRAKRRALGSTFERPSDQ